MTIVGMRLFVLTAKHLNITRAAKDFHISQSAASRQLKQLQGELGAKLLRKNGRCVELTKAGKHYLKGVMPIISQLDTLQKKYTRPKNSLVVAGSYGPSAYLLPSLMTQFGWRHPSEKLILRTGTSAEVEEWLLASEVDLAVVTSRIKSDSLRSELLCNGTVIAFVSALQQATIRAMGESGSGGIPFVLRIRRGGEGLAEAELNTLAKKGFKYKIAMYCESAEAVKEAVRNGAGIGILYNELVQREIDQGDFRPVQIDGLEVTRKTYIVYPREKPLSLLIQEFLVLLRSSVLESNSPQRSTRTSRSRGQQSVAFPNKMSWWIAPVTAITAML